MKKASKLFLGIFLGVSFLAAYGHANAEGVTVSPAIVKFSIDSKNNVDTNAITIKNDATTVVSYVASVVDVDVESGTLLPKETVSEDTKKLFSIQNSTFTLQPGKAINIIVTAKNSDQISPGGHYAAAVFRRIDPTKSGAVPLNQAVSVGMFLTKQDGAVQSIEVSKLEHKKLVFRLKNSESLSFKNTGNVEVVPSANITYTQGAKIFRTATINDVSLPVFSGNSSTFTAKFRNLARMLPGRYTKTIAYRYAGQEKPTVISETFLYIPAWLIAGVAGVVALVLSRIRLRRKPVHKPLEK